MKEIEPWEYIVANQLNYLSGRVVQLVTEYGLTKDIQVLTSVPRLGYASKERFTRRDLVPMNRVVLDADESQTHKDVSIQVIRMSAITDALNVSLL